MADQQAWRFSLIAAVVSACTPVSMDAIVAGGDHACGLRTSDHTVVCWGKLGVDPYDSDPMLVLVAGEDETCGIEASDHTVVCFGELGESVPTGLTERLIDLTAGSQNQCALKESDSTAVCWGYGQRY
jgi:hypothetical protein